MPYDNHYGIPLLDDVHNYFPALLYEHGRFHSVGDIFAYVRQQMHRRFDLFASAQATYRAEPRRQQRVSGPRQPAPAPPPQTYLSPNSQIWNQMIPHARDRQIMLSGTAINSILDPEGFLTGLFNAFPPTAPVPVPLEPVIVRPTEQQIAAATSIELVEREGEICAICQEGIDIGAEARSLNACDHMFHAGCIDTWFERNVRCPVCRHDIRDIVETPTATGDAATTGQPTSQPSSSGAPTVFPTL